MCQSGDWSEPLDLSPDLWDYKRVKEHKPMNTNTARPFVVVADGQANTHCKTLQGAIRSAKGFAPCWTSIVIRHNGEVVKVIR